MLCDKNFTYLAIILSLFDPHLRIHVLIMRISVVISLTYKTIEYESIHLVFKKVNSCFTLVNYRMSIRNRLLFGLDKVGISLTY